MAYRTANVLVVLSLLLATTGPASVNAFVSPRPCCSRENAILAASIIARPQQDVSYILSREQVKPLITLKEGTPKEKVINSFGLLTLFISMITGPVWMMAMMLVDAVCKANEDLDPNRAFFDGTGKIWSKVWLGLSNSYPTITGEVEALRAGHGPCLYVANHASWLDIPVLCTVLDPVFKFIAKSELENVPCIGQQLKGGKHILIDREDRRSQLRTFKEGVAWLNKGVPLMAFPEGMRSLDGRLMEFKGGIFSMATRSKVPIIPISVSHTHAIMPSNALFPVQSGRGKLRVHVHAAILTEGKTEEELEELVRVALLSELPMNQHPLPKKDTTDEGGQEEDKRVLETIQ